MALPLRLIDGRYPSCLSTDRPGLKFEERSTSVFTLLRDDFAFDTDVCNFVRSWRHWRDQPARNIFRVRSCQGSAIMSYSEDLAGGMETCSIARTYVYFVPFYTSLAPLTFKVAIPPYNLVSQIYDTTFVGPTSSE